MWPSEYDILEHRKEMERSAAQARLARQLRTQPIFAAWLARGIASLRRPAQIEQPRLVRPRSAALGRVS